MKKNRGIAFVSITAIIFIFLLIYKQSWITQLLYEQQQLISTKQDLQKEFETLNAQLYQLKNPHAVYQYARNNLGMKPIAITQAKTIRQSKEKS